MTESTPWQLRMFQKTLKKRIRLKELSKIMGNISKDTKCLLVTCGDNNGAMNYYLRELGGQWEFADLELKSIAEMSQLLNQEVNHIPSNNLPYNDNSFDLIVTIDCHEHLKDPVTFTKEIQRIAKDKGRVIITVPGGQKTKIANIIKNAVGMTKEKYGHTREGFSTHELSKVMLNANINPINKRTFSRFFTEMLELGINFLYVKVLSKKSKTKVEEGTIAPATQDQLKSVEKTYKMYSLVYPFFKIISSLDYLLFFTKGYVVIVEGEKRA
jgi:SAM-dependent methyltransferase